MEPLACSYVYLYLCWRLLVKVLVEVVVGSVWEGAAGLGAGAAGRGGAGGGGASMDGSGRSPPRFVLVHCKRAAHI